MILAKNIFCEGSSLQLVCGNGDRVDDFTTYSIPCQADVGEHFWQRYNYKIESP